jgi:hypothetical protein
MFSESHEIAPSSTAMEEAMSTRRSVKSGRDAIHDPSRAASAEERVRDLGS